MKKNKYKKILALLLIVVSCINFYIYNQRNKFEFIQQSAYTILYPNNKKISIHSFKILNDSLLSIELNNCFEKPAKWYIKTDNLYTAETTGLNPVFNLKEGISDYTIMSDQFTDSLVIRAEYHTKAYYADHGYTQNNAVTIYHADIPVEKYTDHLKKWQNNSITLTASEYKELKILLKDSIHIHSSDNTFSKAQKIGKYLCQRITPSKGITSDKTLALGLFNQYKAALKGNKINCGIYAGIFSMLASEAGIINRIVELRHRYGTFNPNIHVFNEYFINEQNQWAAIDIMLNNINYTDEGGKLMNAVQVKNSTRTNNSINVLQSVSGSDSTILQPFSKLNDEFFNYYNIDKDLYYYYNTDTKKVYLFKEKLKRYFLKNPWYEVYSDVSIVDNRPFYIKQLFIIIEAIILILLLLNFFIKKNDRI